MLVFLFVPTLNDIVFVDLGDFALFAATLILTLTFILVAAFAFFDNLAVDLSALFAALSADFFLCPNMIKLSPSAADRVVGCSSHIITIMIIILYSGNAVQDKL